MIVGLGLAMQVGEDEINALITQEVHGQPGMIAADWMYWDGIQQPKGPVSLADLIYCMANGTSPAACPAMYVNTLIMMTAVLQCAGCWQKLLPPMFTGTEGVTGSSNIWRCEGAGRASETLGAVLANFPQMLEVLIALRGVSVTSAQLEVKLRTAQARTHLLLLQVPGHCRLL